jgi:hypothetical protein
MPLTKEYRVFVLDKKVIAVNPYWSKAHYANEVIKLTNFTAIFEQINSHFFTVDIAKKCDGDWIIVELGDGQVAEYSADNSLLAFYQAFSVN